MNRARFFLMAGMLILAVSSVQGDGPMAQTSSESGKIAVTIEGYLVKVSLSMGPGDESFKVSNASVYASGKVLRMDCSKCIEARRAILRAYDFGKIGSTSRPHFSVVVKGTLEFRPVTRATETASKSASEAPSKSTSEAASKATSEAMSKISPEKSSKTSANSTSIPMATDTKAKPETEPVVVVESLLILAPTFLPAGYIP